MVRRLELRDVFNQDPDKLFSYTTQKIVLILNRYLGLLKLLLTLGILLYVAVYVLGIKKAYLEEEYSVGTGLIYSSGTAVAQEGNSLRVWDSVDLVYPSFDPSSVSIPTTISESVKETRGVCTDYLRVCESSEDCLEGGSCKEGYCEEAGWCSGEETLYTPEGVENFLIWFQGNVRFFQVAKDTEFSTLGEKEPEVGQNSFLLRDLLEEAGLNYQSIVDSGVVIRVNLEWDCDVTWDNSCSSQISVEQIEKGFYFERFFYYKEDNTEYRDRVTSKGVKVILQTKGHVYAVTINSIILNLSSAASLTTIIPRILDFLIIYVLKDRKLYREWKYKYTKDLDKETETIEEVPEEEKEEEYFVEGPP